MLHTHPLHTLTHVPTPTHPLTNRNICDLNTHPLTHTHVLTPTPHTHIDICDLTQDQSEAVEDLLVILIHRPAVVLLRTQTHTHTRTELTAPPSLQHSMCATCSNVPCTLHMRGLTSYIRTVCTYVHAYVCTYMQKMRVSGSLLRQSCSNE